MRILIAIALVIALWRAYRWMVDHGWLFDPHDPRRPMGVAAANALATIEGLYDPSAQHIIEFRHGETAWQQFLQAGIPDDPDPGEDDPSAASSLINNQNRVEVLTETFARRFLRQRR